MALAYACICPRASEDASGLGDAAAALSDDLTSHDIETVVVLSGVGSATRRSIGVLTVDAGERAADVTLAERVIEHGTRAALPVDALRRWDGDLEMACELPEGAAVVAVAASRLETRFHVEFGRALAAALGTHERRTAIACVVELSRNAGDATGRIFDEHYRRAIEEWDVKWLMSLDAGVRRRAAEGAVAQTAVMMGALSAYRILPRVLAYETREGGAQIVAAVDVLGERRQRKAMRTNATS